MDNTVEDSKQLFRLLPHGLLQIYGTYCDQFMTGFFSAHADVAILDASWSTVIAAGGGKELEMTVEHTWDQGLILERWDSVFELYCFGEHKILGVAQGRSRFIYLSPFDLELTGQFAQPKAFLFGVAQL